MKLFRILDPFTLTLITVVLLASFFPARGDFVPFFENLTFYVIFALLILSLALSTTIRQPEQKMLREAHGSL